jgi:chaperonin cofactor prefoldin
VLYLQQELAKQQTLEQQRFKQALEKQRLETQMAASEKVPVSENRNEKDYEFL